MREIHTEIVVDAPPSVVWEVLTDFGSYREWNPQIVEARGTARPGERVHLRVRAKGRTRSIPVTVTEATPERTLSWVGRVPVPWVFEGRHTFELEAVEGGTHLVNRERSSGLLVPFVVPTDAEADYETMNEALKRRAESRVEAEAAD
jgi:hypothetical protein